MMDDYISRQAAIDAVDKVAELHPWRVPGKRDTYDSYNEAWQDAADRITTEIEQLPSAQPEITDGQAVEHLQASGWMQNHDKQMYEMGLRERLADDSDSYDALLPSAQPEEDCDTCKHGYFGDDQCNNCRVRYPSHYERRIK